MKITKYLRNFSNLYKDHLFAPWNIPRILGMLTKKYAFTGPLKVTLDITNRCDMGCIMCWYHSPYLKKQKVNPVDMSLETISFLSKELKKIGVKAILLCGEGEPLLHPRIKEIIKAIKNSSLDVEIMTNAYYLDQGLINFLIAYKVNKLIVSLHAPDSETFTKIRPDKTIKDFNRIKNNLLSLKKIKSESGYPRLYISNVISRLNYAVTEKMVDMAKELDADKILFKPLTLSFGLPEEQLVMSESGKQTLMDNLKIKTSNGLPNNADSYIKLFSKTATFAHHKRQQCYIPWISSVITTAGDVIGCPYAQGNALGNIHKELFSSIWFSKNYTNFRKGTLCSGKCLGKIVYPLSV